MKAKDIVGGAGWMLVGLLVLAVLIALYGVFIYGAAWASTKLLPWLSIGTWIALGLIVLVVLPLAIPRSTRIGAGTALYFASFVFGLTVWMEGLLLTLSLFGIVGVIIGLLLAGIGVVPIGIIACAVNGMWLPAGEMLVLLILTYGSRLGGITLVGSLDADHTETQDFSSRT